MKSDSRHRFNLNKHPATGFQISRRNFGMTFSFVFIFVMAISTVHAQVGEKMDAITMPNAAGTSITFNHCVVTKIEPDGVKVSHDGGFAKIPHQFLPEAWKKTVPNDDAKAKEFKEQQDRQSGAILTDAQKVLKAQQDEARLKERLQNEENAQNEYRAKIAALRTQLVGKHGSQYNAILQQIERLRIAENERLASVRSQKEIIRKEEEAAAASATQRALAEQSIEKMKKDRVANELRLAETSDKRVAEQEAARAKRKETYAASIAWQDATLDKTKVEILHVSVASVPKDGLLVNLLQPSVAIASSSASEGGGGGFASGGFQHSGQVLLLTGTLPKNAVDGDSFEIQAENVGTAQYQTVLGATKTVKKYNVYRHSAK